MLVRSLDVFRGFRCLAEACPHSCCAGWEVVVDAESTARYAQAPGALGQRLRAAMEEDGEGDVCFALRDGRCPFLNEKNLCDVHLEWGEAATPLTCREHPRFTEDYGPFREVTFSAACPEANRLLLGSDAPLEVWEEETDEPGGPGDPWLRWLEPLRDEMLRLLCGRGRSLNRRLAALLDIAGAVQCMIDAEDEAALAKAAYLVEGSEPGGGKPGLFPAALELLSRLEPLEPDWPGLLLRAETAEDTVVRPEQLERVVVYFAFRYLLKTVNDGAYLARARFVVFSALAVERLAAVCGGVGEALRRYSREVEHDADNVAALTEELEAEEWGALLLGKLT